MVPLHTLRDSLRTPIKLSKPLSEIQPVSSSYLQGPIAVGFSPVTSFGFSPDAQSSVAYAMQSSGYNAADLISTVAYFILNKRVYRDAFRIKIIEQLG